MGKNVLAELIMQVSGCTTVYAKESSTKM